MNTICILTNATAARDGEYRVSLKNDPDARTGETLVFLRTLPREFDPWQDALRKLEPLKSAVRPGYYRCRLRELETIIEMMYRNWSLERHFINNYIDTLK